MAIIVRRHEDWYCIVFHLLVCFAYSIAFFVYTNRIACGIDNFWELFAFIVAAIVMLGWISALDVGVNFHNHVHKSVFHSRFLNRWFGRLWTVTGGWPAGLWIFAHIDVHHKGLLENADWTLPRRIQGKFESIYTYCLLHYPWRYTAAFCREFVTNRKAFWARKPIFECFFFLVVWLVPWFIDPTMAFFLWLLPQWFGNVVVMGAGMYVQHLNCSSPGGCVGHHRHSNQFTSWFFNATMFNIGYHVTHHELPGIHWADLEGKSTADRVGGRLDGARFFPFGYYKAAWMPELLSMSPEVAQENGSSEDES